MLLDSAYRQLIEKDLDGDVDSQYFGQLVHLLADLLDQQWDYLKVVKDLRSVTIEVFKCPEHGLDGDHTSPVVWPVWYLVD